LANQAQLEDGFRKRHRDDSWKKQNNRVSKQGRNTTLAELILSDTLLTQLHSSKRLTPRRIVAFELRQNAAPHDIESDSSDH